MFARKLSVEVVEGSARRPAPQAWLDEYFMKNFIRPGVFDETLVTGEGEMEAGFAVPAEEVRKALEGWWRGRRIIAPEARVEVREQ
jgi:hypothetical protein